MKRVMITGQPGAGKSTLARAIGNITGLPIVHVDLIHWMPGWVERDKAEKIRLATIEEAKDSWVFEGGLSQTWENRLARADTLICLDFALSLRAWRVFKRTLRDHGRSRPDLPEECPERFEREFWLWIWNTRRTGKEKMYRLMDKAPADMAVHHLQTPRQVQAFLDELETKYA